MVTILHAPYFTIFFTIMKAEAILLNYISTRGGVERLSSAEAILQGLSGNGGLFVPEEIPTVSEAFIEGLVPLTYEERAVRVLKEFLTDYGEDEIRGCVTRAYGGRAPRADAAAAGPQRARALARADERVQGHGAPAAAAAHEHGAQEDG